MAIYAIGDLQGCADQFSQLLDNVGFSGNDVVWLVGDLINRGPKSLETIRQVKAMGSQAITVLGNHDLHLIAAAYGHRALSKSDTLDEILAAPDKIDLIEWLRHQPLLHYDADLAWTMVHAGLAPQWTHTQACGLAADVEQILRSDDIERLLASMYNNKPKRWSETLVDEERWRFTINCLTRLRFCHADGSLALKEKGNPGANTEYLPWYAHPERLSTDHRIVFGHWSTLGVRQTHNVWSLDSGCVWGGSLTAMRLDSDEPHLHQVTCPMQQSPTGV